MNNFKFYLGPPGTGKTTKLLNIVDEYLSVGTPPEKIGYVSFTRKSVQEARDRASHKFMVPKNHFKYFRTIHSMAFNQLGFTPEEVFSNRHYVDFGSSIGIPICNFLDPEEGMNTVTEGDELLFEYTLSRLRMESAVETCSRKNYFRESLKNYKRRHLLHDYTDMLEIYLYQGSKPDLDILIVDEAQDLCLLQWKIVEAMARYAKKVVVAGDDDQAIFSWAGADVQYFISKARESEQEVLHHSYRLGKEVYDLSATISSKIHDRLKKSFIPSEHPCTVETKADLTQCDLHEGTWLILVRNKYLIEKVTDSLMAMGVYFSAPGMEEVQEMIEASFAWERVRTSNVGASAEEIRKFYPLISKENWVGGRKPRMREDFVSKDAVEKMFGTLLCSPWYEALDKMPEEYKVYLRSARKANEKFTEAPRIIVSTIHGAKGGEADNVALLSDMSRKTYSGMMEDPDNENRVLYVAITRARKKFIILIPKTSNCYWRDCGL